VRDGRAGQLGHVALDGTKIKANASKHKAMSYEAHEETRGGIESEVARMLAAARGGEPKRTRPSERKAGDEMPDWVGDKQKRLAKISGRWRRWSGRQAGSGGERRIEAEKEQQRKPKAQEAGKPAARHRTN